MLVASLLRFLKFPFLPVLSCWIYFPGPCIFWCDNIVLWEQFFGVPTLGGVSLILRSTLDGTLVSTLGGSVSPTLISGDVCSALGGEPGLFRRA